MNSEIAILCLASPVAAVAAFAGDGKPGTMEKLAVQKNVNAEGCISNTLLIAT
jgi:hypothetical protein